MLSQCSVLYQISGSLFDAKFVRVRAFDTFAVSKSARIFCANSKIREHFQIDAQCQSCQCYSSATTHLLSGRQLLFGDREPVKKFEKKIEL